MRFFNRLTAVWLARPSPSVRKLLQWDTRPGGNAAPSPYQRTIDSYRFSNDSACRTKVEVPGYHQSRKFRFCGVGLRPSWYVRTAVPGSRLVRLPKAEATELAPEAIGTRPSHSDYNPGGLNRSPKRAFRFGQPIAYGETPERRLWAYKREDRRAAFARRFQIAF